MFPFCLYSFLEIKQKEPQQLDIIVAKYPNRTGDFVTEPRSPHFLSWLLSPPVKVGASK